MTVTAHRFAFTAMASPCELHLAGPRDVAERAADAAMREVARIEAKYSRYREDSVASAINRSAGDDAGFEPGVNTATMKHYIDFCADHGIPYHSLDGMDNLAWYGGPILPYRGDDITTGRPGLDFQEVIDHADRRGNHKCYRHLAAGDRCPPPDPQLRVG